MLQVCPDYSDPLSTFLHNFESRPVNFYVKAVEILIVLSLEINLRRTDILTIPSL